MSARRSIIPVFVPHLGCPHRCVFCNQNRISGESEAPTAETVKTAIEKAAALTPSETKRQLAFYGGSFTATAAEYQRELLAAAQPFLKAGVIDSIRLSTRPDAVDDAVLARLKKYGVTLIELGAQSLDDEVLMKSARGHTAADVERASRKIKAAGFELILQMMTGLPADTPEKDIETARKIIALRPDGVRIYPTVIVKDTPLYELWREGRYTEHTVEDAVCICAELLPMFKAAGTAVIRLGLNPTEELSGGAAVAGAYHPALGELVASRIMLGSARELLKGVPPGAAVTIGVSRREVSKMIGRRRENIETLISEFSLKSLKVSETELKDGEIKLIGIAMDG